MKAKIKPIYDFDEQGGFSDQIIGWIVDHPLFGDKGLIFKSKEQAKNFVISKNLQAEVA